MAQLVTYWFAVQSPFVYLGHERTLELCRRHGATIDFKPFDIAKVFAATGGVPLSQRPQARKDYRLAELRRWSAYLKLPLHLNPKFFPVSGEPASKMILAAAAAHGEDAALKLASACTSAVWAHEGNIADADSLCAIADAAGLPGRALLEASQRDEFAARYAANTEAAIASGVFGAPSFSYNGELLWGQDRLDFLDRALAADRT